MDTSGDDSKSGGTDAAAITITDSGGLQLNKVPMNERRRFVITVRMILRLDCRDLFGVEFSNRVGDWLDRHMTDQVSKYGYWVAYPEGNHVLHGHSDKIYAAALSSDGRYLFTGGNHGSIIVWDLLDNSMLKQFKASDSGIGSLIYERDLLASGNSDWNICIFNGITHDIIHTLEGDSGSVGNIQFNRKCSQIVSVSSDNSVRIWSVQTGECLATLAGHTSLVNSAYFMDNDTKVISASDKSIKVWSVMDKSECDTITDGIDGIISDMCVNCDGSLVACCFLFNGIITVYNYPKMDIVRSMEVKTIKSQFHRTNPDILAVIDHRAQSIYVYNIRSGDRLVELKGHSDQINELCWSRDGLRLVSVACDTTVRVWDCTALLK